MTLSGYTGAAQYRLLKTDGTLLSGLVDVGSTVVVLSLNPGDSCKVEVYDGTGSLMGTKTVTTTAGASNALISATPPTMTLTVGQTQNIAVSVTPSDAVIT